MKSKVLSKIISFDRALSKISWRTYKRIVCKLCSDHPDQEWSKLIPGYLRSKQILPLLELADSLVAQKQHATAKDHFLANQISALIRKYPFPKEMGLPDPNLKAKETWIEMEQKCSFLNSRFEFPYWGPFWKEYEKMRNFINYVLSDRVPLQKIYSECDVGPGASVGVHGNATNLARKFGGVWTVSPTARDYAYASICHNWHALELLNSRPNMPLCLDPVELNKAFMGRIRTVSYNNVTFVPKTVKTSRSIAVEPLLNTFLQKGVDTVMRRNLLRVGIDLRHQSINSEMARQGSLSDTPESFVTIDLSSASDSISIGLCRQILPPDWFHFLNSIRSMEYKLDGTVYQYQKFCSMGNGFCFPLETLLFTAACHAVGCGTSPKDFHVYGDDIIVRKRHADKLILLLQDMGFEVNSNKSFLDGNFRESCGSDWYSGDDVRPTTLDYELDSLQDIFKFWNLTRRSPRTSVFFDGIFDILCHLIPTELRFFRPVAGNEDSAMTVEKDIFMSSPHSWWSKDLQAWGWKEVVSLPFPDKGWKHLDKSNILLVMAALRGSSSKVPFAIRRKAHKAIRKVAYSPNLPRFGGGANSL
jgi:hypothetical protein